MLGYTLLGRHPLGRHITHLGRQTLGRHPTAPPSRWLLLRLVRILLECILVIGKIALDFFFQNMYNFKDALLWYLHVS